MSVCIILVIQKRSVFTRVGQLRVPPHTTDQKTAPNGLQGSVFFGFWQGLVLRFSKPNIHTLYPSIHISPSIHTYIRTYTHTFIHTSIPNTSIHISIHTLEVARTMRRTPLQCAGVTRSGKRCGITSDCNMKDTRDLLVCEPLKNGGKYCRLHLQLFCT